MRCGYWPCVLCACGRLGFDQRVGGDAATDGARDAAVRAAVAYVAPFLQQHPGSGASDSVMVQAAAAGDAIAIQVSCSDMTTPPTAVTATIAGWTLVPLGALNGSTALAEWSQSYAATAPSTAPAAFTVTWTGTTCGVGKAELADEFAPVPAGAGIAVDAHAEAQGTGDCLGSVATGAADDAVWAACFSFSMLTAVGQGFTMGANDQGGDWSEYELTSDPAGTLQSVSFANAPVAYTLAMMTIHAGS